MNDNININDSHINPSMTFRRLCFLHMQQLTNFPYIEKDFDALTDYELLCLVVKYLNDVINNSNHQNESITNLYNAFLQLQTYMNNSVDELEDAFNQLNDYVRDYFDNLDVQDEINNKLDQMLEDGVLTEIIQQFLQSTAIWCFDTVADMKLATNLIDGSYARTLGYYAVNDGGGATYKITDTENLTDYQEELDTGLYATLIINNEVNAKQCGAYGDDTHDDTNALQASATLAQTKGVNLLIPNGTYLTDTITIENIKNIKIDGEIKLSSNTEVLNIFENVNGATPKIYINKVTIGNIIMKGLNSAKITIQNAYKLILLADNTSGHSFIAYNTFELGFIRYLEITDDGSGTKWINENLFTGGRFLGITIGGGNSNYKHNNNLFIKPQCENTTINILYGSSNRIIDARLEGDISINFSADSLDNYITCNYASTIQGRYWPKYYGSLQSHVTDLSRGRNKVINNNDLTEHLVLSINKFNNPKNITVDGDNLKMTGRTLMFESDFISLPPIDIMLYFKTSNMKVQWLIRTYDENFTLLSSNPNLIYNSAVIGYAAQGSYGNVSYTRDSYWALIDSSNQLVKYIKIFVYSSTDAVDELYKNIEMYLTHYGKLENEGYYLEGFGKCVTN